jgi:MATE family multidrug resistance protein
VTDDPARYASVRGLLRLSLPLAASTGLGFFLHYVNRTVLSWHSPEALAASLPAGMLGWTAQSFFILSCAYLGTFAAQAQGEGRPREAGAMAWPMLALAGCAGAVCLVLVLFRHPLAALFGTEPVVAAQLGELLGWYLAETGPIAACAGLAGFCGGLGRSRLVLLFSVAGAALCIGLNYVLVLGKCGLPRLGVTGAGLASVGTAVLMLAAWLGWFFAPAQRRDFGTWQERNLARARVLRFCRFALPRGATEVLEMVAFISFTAVIAHLGTVPLAANNVAFSTYLALVVPVIGFCQGVGIATGAAVGAGRPELARRAVRSAIAVLLPYSLILAAAFLLVPRLLLAPARGDDPVAWAAIEHAALPVMWCLAVLAPVDALQWIWRFAVQGAGDTRWPFAVLVALAVVLLGVPIWFVPTLFGGRALVGCYLLLVGYTAVVALVMAWRFHRGPWPRMRVLS